MAIRRGNEMEIPVDEQLTRRATTPMDSAVRTIVVMGGMNLQPESVLAKLERAHERGKGHVISVQVELWPDNLTREEVMLRASAGLKNGQVQVADGSALLEKGFTLESWTEDGAAENHHHIHFSDDEPTVQKIEALVECFGQPEPNPARSQS